MSTFDLLLTLEDTEDLNQLFTAMVCGHISLTGKLATNPDQLGDITSDKLQERKVVRLSLPICEDSILIDQGHRFSGSNIQETELLLMTANPKGAMKISITKRHP